MPSNHFQGYGEIQHLHARKEVLPTNQQYYPRVQRANEEVHMKQDKEEVMAGNHNGNTR